MAKAKMRKKVVKHLKGDIKMFKHEASEDKELIKALKQEKKRHDKHEKGESKREERREDRKEKKDPKPYPKGKKARMKEEKVFHEAAEGKLHSGSKKGPLVKKRSQVIAIALSEGRKAASKKPKKRKK